MVTTPIYFICESYFSLGDEGRLPCSESVFPAHGLASLRGIIADVTSDGDSSTSGVRLEQLMERLRAGDVRTLARVVSLIEDGDAGAVGVVAACKREGRKALRIGVTGPTGTGKSTLVDQMVRWLRADGRRVGVIAVDPSSPFTGGALLGDRIRMQGFVGDDGVFIRSMASRGTLGGLARGVADVCAVMEASGREAILIETVGVGQDEVDVVRVADVTVVVLVPGMGDEVQSLKAGVMEVADVFVVNKADREGAERLEAEVLAMQGLSTAVGHDAVPVMRTVAVSGEGVAELMKVVMDISPGAGAPCPVSGTCAPSHPDVLRLDHLGVAVRSIAAAQGFYAALGLVAGIEKTVEHEHVKVAMLELGESRIELLEATAEDSVIGGFVAKRGEGLHHVAIRVAEVDAMFERLKQDGIRLASEVVRVGVGGRRYFFVHPASTGGVLVQIVGGAA